MGSAPAAPCLEMRIFTSPHSLSSTAPGPVSDFRVANVSMREIGLAWRSNDSESFEIFITQDGGGMHRNASTGNQSYVVEDLKPGTSYHFEIVPRGPDGTKGPPRTIDGRTGKHLDTVKFLTGSQSN